MSHLSGRAIASAIAVLGSAGCTPIAAFDALVPKDGGVEVFAKDVAYGNDPRQKLDIYRPRSVGARQLPIIVFFYGGSWDSGTRKGYSFVGRALAAKGFLVVIPDYRLVPQVRYPEFIRDGSAAVHWIINHGSEAGGDPERIILAGHSAGAYNAAMLAYDSRWLGKDLGRIRAFVGLAGPYDFLPLSGPITEAAFAGTSDIRSTQPVYHVRKGSVPAFLATGSQDHVVRPKNSDALSAALRKFGSPVVRREYSNIGHVGILTTISRPLRSKSPVLNDIVQFARRYSSAR